MSGAHSRGRGRGQNKPRGGGGREESYSLGRGGTAHSASRGTFNDRGRGASRGTSRGRGASRGTAHGFTSRGSASRGTSHDRRAGTSRGTLHDRGSSASRGTSHDRRAGTSRGTSHNLGSGASRGTSHYFTSRGSASRGTPHDRGSGASRGTSHGRGRAETSRGTLHGWGSGASRGTSHDRRGSTSRGTSHDRGRGTSRGTSHDRGSGASPGTSHGWRAWPSRKPGSDLKLNSQSLQLMMKKDPDNLVLEMTSDRYFSAIKSLLNEPELTADIVVLVLKVFSRACDCELTRHFLIKLLNTLPKSPYLSIHLSRYLNRMPDSWGKENSQEREIELKCAIKLFGALLKKLPTSFADLPLPQLQCMTSDLLHMGVLQGSEIKAAVDQLHTMKDEISEKVKKEVEERANKPRQIYAIDEAALLDNEAPPSNFRHMSVRPDEEDIHSIRPVFFRRNKIEGRYDGPEHYLDVQFRLLREDFFHPLREGIQVLSEVTTPSEMESLQDIRVYKKVRILDPVYTYKGVTHRISFDVFRMRGVKWENSKRLIYGSLLCLSKDNFETFLLATVENRDVRSLERGILEVKFDMYNFVDPGRTEYQMVETTAYYESYRHVLEGLQKTSIANFPFERYIVECEPEVQPPGYLKKKYGKDVTFDLTPIMQSEAKRRTHLSRHTSLFSNNQKGRAVKLLDKNSWPSAKDLQLDSSQLKAVQLALTNEFAIIQGPPGTGKTYMGLKVVRVLLHNKQHWNNLLHDETSAYSESNHRPLLVVCYTNHALDQFLEGIHEFHPEGIVRVGGRSQSEIMQQCSLRELKKKTKAPHGIRKQCYELNKELEITVETLENMELELKELRQSIVPAIQMRNEGVLSKELYESLMAPCQGVECAVSYWLGVVPSMLAPIVPNFLEANGVLLNGEMENVQEDEGATVEYEANIIQAQRILDDEYEDFHFGNRGGKPRRPKNEPFATPHQLDGFTIVKHKGQMGFEKKKLNQTIRKELAKTDVMNRDMVLKITDVWGLSQQERWRLYRCWITDLRQHKRQFVIRFQNEVEECAQRLAELRRFDDLRILNKALVIGMTTTGAAKYRELIQKIKPRITVVEEAAEVLEAHIVTSLSPECQHLILIGDHQQLRPSPTVYKLAKDYKLEVSLFERMVKNGMKFEKLHAQHRMRPEIARMMSHIYENLENHESVLNFESIKGVSTNIFFVEHSEREDLVKEGRSRSNSHEAKYLVALCKYFILQGYEPEKITILTMYVGQLMEIKKQTDMRVFKGVRVCAVDNFQGEENDIILLSLVRSNEQENIGFLRIPNRVCVALSRAKKGFYCIGNIELMCKKETLWNNIITDMRTHGKVGPYLTLACQNHPMKQIEASKAEDFAGAPDGGCLKKCGTKLHCGHVCRLYCHPKDPNHVEYNCREACMKKCELGHQCNKKCYQDCGRCNVHVAKKLPQCSHFQQVPCHLPPIDFQCRVPCRTLLACGHHCTGTCHNCYQQRLHQPCRKPCEQTLMCGHVCPEKCAGNMACLPCEYKCENVCVHKLKCHNKCGEPCQPCTIPCAWKCQHHKCTRICGEPCNRPRCKHPCKKKLKCKHPCIGMCGEPCPKKCRVCDKDDFGDEEKLNARFVELQPCGHVIEVNTMDTWMDKSVSRNTTTSIQLKRCPRCTTPIRMCPRYGSIIKTILADIEEVKAENVLSEDELDQEQTRLTALCFTCPIIDHRSKSNVKAELMLCKFQINSLNLLSKMDLRMKNVLGLGRSRFQSRYQSKWDDTAKENLKLFGLCRVEEIRQRVKCLSCHCSQQEKEELDDEILRLQLTLSYMEIKVKDQNILLEETDQVQINVIGQAITSAQRIDDVNLRNYTTNMDRICSLYKSRRSFVTPLEMPNVIEQSSCSFAERDWLKCPKGHLYYIASCVDSSSRCPKCSQH